LKNLKKEVVMKTNIIKRFIVEGITYELLDGGSVAVVESDRELAGAVTIPAKVVRDGVTYSVTEIGVDAFTFRKFVTAIALPDSVIKIGSSFTCCESLKSVMIPRSVTSIEINPFPKCTRLERIEVSEGNSTYASCDGVLFNAGMTLLIACPGNRKGHYTIPDSVTEIGDHALSGCESLTSVEIPDSVTRVGRSAFSDCKSLTSVEIPDSVTRIGENAYCNCLSLRSAVIPELVTRIGNKAFAYCESLTSVEIPDSVEIGEEAFEGTPWQKSGAAATAHSSPSTSHHPDGKPWWKFWA
jgi:hypothetical protein